MISEKNISVFLTVSYFVFSGFVLFYVNQNLVYELVFKVFALLCLSFLYLTKSNRINFWYLLVLLFCIVSDSLLVYGDEFILQGTVLLLFSRIAYIFIVKDAVYRHPLKTMLKYSVPFFVPFVAVFSLIYNKLDNLLYPSIILGILSIILGLFSFLNYLDKNTSRSFNFFLGIFTIIVSDILMTISHFINEQRAYVIIYHIMYYVALFIICNSMIVKKTSRSI